MEKKKEKSTVIFNSACGSENNILIPTNQNL